MASADLTFSPGSLAHQEPTRPWLFWWLRRRLFLNGFNQLLATSRLRVSLVVVVSVLLWALLYVLFSRGFQFLQELQKALPIAHQLITLVFGMFFLVLMGLMVFSTSLMLYGSLFRSKESEYLLSLPARPDRIFIYKFQEALYFSGWGFLLLGTPLLVAYGVQMNSEWHYYVLFLPYMIGFLLCPGALGACACLLLVYYLPRRRKQALFGVLTLLGLLLVAWAIPATLGSLSNRGAETEEWLFQLINQRGPSAGLLFLPSQWLTNGLMSAAVKPAETIIPVADSMSMIKEYVPDKFWELRDAIFYLLLIWSTGLFGYLATTWLAWRLYRPAYDRVASTGGTRRRFGNIWLDGFVHRILSWTDKRTRIFVIKDMRTFRRDPVQWAQVLILGGILLLYFLNLPRLSNQNKEGRSVIAFLNLAVLSLMLATYTCRFIFPLMSLEGNKFWILGLLPIERDRLLHSKFIYSVGFTMTTSLVLTLVSGLMLKLAWQVVLFQLMAVLILAVGLSGISVGLGAYLVNLKDNNPSKIATGFGGTINLLVSLAFAIIVVALAAVPTLTVTPELMQEGWVESLIGPIGAYLVLCTAALLAVGYGAITLPMQMGRRAFRKMEF